MKRGTKAFPNGFDLTFRPHKINFPLTIKEPSMIFVDSMFDSFHEEIPFTTTDLAFDVMEKAHWHIFQNLTKRPWIMAAYIKRRYSMNNSRLPKHIWLGVSVENDDWIWRMDQLRQIPCDIRFVSAEPLTGPLTKLNLDGISWIICGGMSGPNYEKSPMNLEWARDILRRCREHEPPVSFFFKQVSHRFPGRGEDALGQLYQEVPVSRDSMED